jgi:hypothetical protein
MLTFFKSLSPDVWFGIGVAVVSFLVGCVITLIRKLNIRTKCKHPLFCNGTGKDFTKVHTQVNELLTEMRLELDSARVFISQFHNGGDFFTGESILKFSITHESCSLGVVNTIDQQQGVLLTRFIEKLKILQEDEPRLIFTNTLVDSHFKGFLEARNTIAFILVPLRSDSSLTPYGYYCCEWCSWAHVDALNADVVDTFEFFVKKNTRIINTLLTSK